MKVSISYPNSITTYHFDLVSIARSVHHRYCNIVVPRTTESLKLIMIAGFETWDEDDKTLSGDFNQRPIRIKAQNLSFMVQ